MADAIDHDGTSTVATVGSKAVKYGALAGLAALALPIALGAATLFIGVPAIIGASTVSGALVAGGLTLLGGVATWLTAGYAGVSALVGGSLGVLKGAVQVSKENSAFRQRVTERMQGRENKQAKLFND